MNRAWDNGQADNSRARILVVDDDETILELVKDVLSEKYEIMGENSAAGAIQRLECEPFALLILDLGLPGLSGVDAVRRIRSNSGFAHLPILVVSAYTELRRLVADLRVDGLLAKPFSLDQLEAQVAELVEENPLAGHRYAVTP